MCEYYKAYKILIMNKLIHGKMVNLLLRDVDAFILQADYFI